MEEDNSSQPPETRVDEDSKTNERNQLKRKRKKSVRFAPGTAQEPTTKRVIKRRRCGNVEPSSDCDPSTWYTRHELKDILKSIFLTVQVQDCMSSMSLGQATTIEGTVISGDPRFLLQYRERCKLIRLKMYETIKNVKDFETATGNKVPPELLSEHLRIFSKPMEMDALEWASNRKNDVYDPAACTPMEMPLRKREDPTEGSSMIG